MPVTTNSDSNSDKKQAVAFTAGIKGGYFAAGTIHAWLAADRPKPDIAAGISTGAISAAAMQAALLEINSADYENASSQQKESMRWRWFRTYIASLTDRPLDVIWDAIPDVLDFFADRNISLIKDSSLGAGFDEALKNELRTEEMKANRRKYLMTGLGQWFGACPIRVSRFTEAIVFYVRWKEGYGGWVLTRPLRFAWSAGVVAVQTLWHVVKHPQFMSEGLFDGTSSLPRPLFGWRFYSLATAVLGAYAASLICLLIALVVLVAGGPAWVWFWWGIALPGATVLGVAGWRLWRWFNPVRVETEVPKNAKWRQKILDPLLNSVGFERSLLSNFHLRKRLYELFGDADVNDKPFPTLLVTAPLQTLYRDCNDHVTTPGIVEPRQIWANPSASASSLRVVDALIAATAIPGIWPPHRIEASEFGNQWMPIVSKECAEPGQLHPHCDAIDLVDGSAVRKNPLPALLQYLTEPPGSKEELAHWDFHVIYSTRMNPAVTGPAVLNTGTVSESDANIVNVARLSRELENRRDTEMEVKQMNFVSCLVEAAQTAGITAPEAKRLIAKGNEIAPGPPEPHEKDTSLTPREHLFAEIASGCRRTLSSLYRKELMQTQSIGCKEFLQIKAPKRNWKVITSPGLSEVCQRCSGRLQAPPEPGALAASRVHEAVPTLARRLPQDERRPRVVFVASGGVFRGCFHIGMIAALHSCKLQPDLIAGASVGTLMGGAMAALFRAPDAGHAHKMLNRFVDVFERVNQLVALTKTIKSASRELGIRGREIRLSPNSIRKVLTRGSQADAAYATTGSPPELLDAISKFFSIPINETRTIASNFVAGQVEGATKDMLKKIQEYTLRGLGIEEAVLGASLLEIQVRRLISLDANEQVLADYKAGSWQPFAPWMGCLASSTNLGAQSMALFWDAEKAESYRVDFIKAALASSAFPAVFRPVRASEIFPGIGDFNVRYSDGGLFDNLPFLPAIEALSAGQKNLEADAAQKLEMLRGRAKVPDLFLAGALNANPESAVNRDGPFTSFTDVSKRAANVGVNSKINSFISTTRIVDSLLNVLGEHAAADRLDGFTESVVNAAILPVIPADSKHLNPTFAFCASTGFKPEKVLRSIADGCYQTFAALAEGFQRGDTNATLRWLHDDGRLDKITHPPRSKAQRAATALGKCPYFYRQAPTGSAVPVECPLADLEGADPRRLYRICVNDVKHS